MILDFAIPNGRMKVNLEEFAAGAVNRKVRKLFQMYAQSGPEPEEVRKMQKYLKEQAEMQGAESLRNQRAFEQEDQKFKSQEMEYRRLRKRKPFITPNEKERWKAEKANVRKQALAIRSARYEYRLGAARAQRKAEKYQAALEMSKEIFS